LGVRTELPSRKPSGLRRGVAALCACASIGALLLTTARPALASDDFTWGGTGSTTATTDYNTGTNWSNPPAGAPPVNPAQFAIFDSTGSSNIVVTSGPINPGDWLFNPASQSFSISGADVNFVGSGITNNASAGQTITISNNIGEAVFTTGVHQSGASTLILSGSNTYSGPTQISEGTLVAAHASAGTIDALGTGPVFMTGGALQFSVDGTFNNSITVNSLSPPDPATGVISAGSHSVELTNAVSIGPSATLQFGKAGDTGTLLLSGTGGTVDPTAVVVVAGGTLKDNGNGAITGLTFSASSTTVNAGATLDFNDSFNQAIRNLNGGGNVRMGDAGNNLTLYVDGGTTQTFAGSISGNNGSVLIQITGGPPGPTGTMIFTGANTYSGGTTICSCAALQLGDASHTGSIVGDVTVYGKLNIVSADTSGITSITNDREFKGATPGKTTFSNATSAGTIAITNLHAGKTVFNDTSTAAGATIVNRLNGTTVFNNSATAGGANITNRNNGETDFNNKSSAGSATIVNRGGGLTSFANNSTAGSADIINRNGGATVFNNKSSAGSANITNRAGSATYFQDSSTAGSATIVNRFAGQTIFNSGDAGTASITNLTGGVTTFNFNSNAGSATIVNNSHGFSFAGYPYGLAFFDSASAGNATIINNSGGVIFFGYPFFGDTTTAANATITNNAASSLFFNGLSTAGNATITALSGSAVYFTGASTGGNAQFITSGTGFVDFSGTIGPHFDGVVTAGSIAGSGFYYLGSNTLVVGSNNLSTEVSGVISDSTPCGCPSGPGSLAKVGSGQLTLSGVNTYSGSTTVDGGFLNVMGSIASSSGTTVNAGGALTGSGIVSDTTIASGGIFLPGSGFGTSMSVQGNLAFQSGALYLVQLSSTNSTFADVTGTAHLSGDVAAAFAPGSTVMKQYMILHAASGVSGTFDGLSVAAPNNLVASLSYDPTHAYINFDLNFGAKNNLNVNQTNVANALTNFFNSNGGIPGVFASLSPAGLTQASGELATGTQQATFNAMNLFLSLLTDPFVAGRGSNVSAGGGAQPYAEEESSLAYAAKTSGGARDALARMPTKAVARNDLLDNRWSVWGSAFGGGADISGNAALGSNNANVRAFGFAAGADYRISPATIAGFALAGGGTNFSVTGLGYGRSDMFQAGAFVRHSVGAAYVTGALAYGGQEVTTDRFVTVAGIDHLRAQFNSNAWSGRLEGGYRYATPWMGITPYAAAQFTTIDLPAYAEQVIAGTGLFALNYNARSVTDPRSELGVRTDRSFAMSNGILTLRGRLAWAHDYTTDRNVTPVFQSLPGAFFVVNGAAQAHDSALTTASAEMRWLNGWSAAATFEGEFSNVMNSYAGKAVVRYAW
jgi:autotransporter-associated beta strand protein